MSKNDRAGRWAGNWVKAPVLVAAVAVLLTAAPRATVQAQDIRLPDKLSSDATTPQSLDALIRDAAEKQKARGGLGARYGFYTIVWPKDAAERDDLAQHTIVLVTVLSQKQEELPLRRVYLVTPDGRAADLRQIGSWRSAVNPKSLAYTELGKSRQDAFYLIPGAAALRDGEVRLDFAVNRTGFVLMRLPVIKQDLGFVFAEPPPGAEPKREAERNFIQRQFPGFPVPKL